MEDLQLDSTNLATTEEFLVRASTAMRIGGHGENARTQIHRRWMGPVNLDELSFNFDLQFNARALGRVCVGRVASGCIESRFAGVRDVYGPGDITLIAPPDQPYAGQVSHAKYDVTMIDTDQLERVAAPGPGADKSGGIKLLGHRPVSTEAGNQLGALIGYFRERVLANPDFRDSELVASTAAMHLASVVLATFPNNAQIEPTGTDRNDARPAQLRRAVAYIEEYANTDISVVDIAEHVHMTPRGVQYMFRRALDCTPMEYVRRVRLDHAHRELVAATPDSATVAQIATRWGFAHKGRFARHYRHAYGRSPHESLHH